MNHLNSREFEYERSMQATTDKADILGWHCSYASALPYALSSLS